MNVVFVVAIVFAGIVISLAIVGGTILMAIRIRHGGLGRKGQHSDAEDAKMIQEIYHGLSRMEERVEALETILMESHGKERQG
ncbi:MAG: phage-shock protein [Desulfobacterales bacterium]|nr:phage-shock protein [Desulfobacterales bacterium]